MKRHSFLILILVWLTLSFNGCRSVQKRKATVKKVVNTTETGQRKIITKGDSIIFVPNIKYKDTTITRYHKNVILTTIYDKQGQVDSVKCKQKAQEVIEDYIKQQQTKETSKTNDVERTPIQPIWFVYAGIIIILGIVANNLTKKTPKI